MPLILASSAALAYIVGSVLLLLRIFNMQFATRNLVLFFCFIASLLHSLVLTYSIIESGSLDFGLFATFSLCSNIASYALLFAYTKQPLEYIGILVFPVAASAVILNLGIDSPPGRLDALSWQLTVHISLSILAFAIVSISTAHALLIGIQQYYLHRRPNRLMASLPPLQSSERLLFQVIGVGWVLLSLSILSGVFFINDIFAQHLAHKTVFSILSWIVLAILLWGRIRFGWRGSTAVKFTLSGMLFLSLAYFGTKFVLEILLHR